MHIDFTSRRVLVSASTAGIGFAAARQFVDAGASVILNGRTQESVSAAIDRIASATGRRDRVDGFVGDLGTAAGCLRLAKQYPEIDILINNLGIYGPQDFFDTPDDQWERFFQTNVMSGVRLARAYAPWMVSRGWGRIIFVSSESAINIPADMIHYGFTKTAQLAVSRGLAKRLAGTGVTVNSVLPGPALSEGVADMLKSEVDRSAQSLEQVAARFIAAHRSSSILQRAATVDEVAHLILYAASEQASATTGAALRVDGGVIDTIA